MDLDADEIIPGLWQGSLPPVGAAVGAAGFDLLVLCAQEYQPPVTLFQGVRVVQAPNEDSAPSRAQFEGALRAAREVAVALAKGQKTLVTCSAGMNRSGLVSALALHLLFGWSGSRCIELIQRKRRSIAPFSPLSNPYFVEALERLARRSRGRS